MLRASPLITTAMLADPARSCHFRREAFWVPTKHAAHLGPLLRPLGPLHQRASRRPLLWPQQHIGHAWGQVVQEVAFEGIELPEELSLSQPSRGLRELVQAQLQFLFSHSCLADPAGPPCRVSCYARCAEALDAPGPADLQLQRVATWPARSTRPSWMSSAAGLASASLEEDDLLILRSSPAGPGGIGSSSSGGLGSSSGSGPQQAQAYDAEASLVAEEVVLLPNSNTLVLPLADQGVLMGLVVVEGHAQQHGAASSSNSSSSTSSGDEEEAGYASGSSGAGSTWGGLHSWEEGAGGELDGDDPTSSTSSSSSSAAACVGLSEAQLGCLRGAVPMLAKACALDLRAAWDGLAAAARQARAASLLLEVRGPLHAIGTFGRMLVPRLPEGEPDRDMASGIMLQERRLQEVVAQLEAALKPAAAAAAAAAVTTTTPAAWLQFSPPQALPQQPSLSGPREPLPEMLTDGRATAGACWGPKLLPPGEGGVCSGQAAAGGWRDSRLSSSSSREVSEAGPWEAAVAVASEARDSSSSSSSSPLAMTASTGADDAAGGVCVVYSDSPYAAAAAPDAVWPPELPGALRGSQRDIRWQAAAAGGAARPSSPGGMRPPLQVAATTDSPASSSSSSTATAQGAQASKPLVLPAATMESSVEDDMGWVGPDSRVGGASDRANSSSSSSSSADGGPSAGMRSRGNEGAGVGGNEGDGVGASAGGASGSAAQPCNLQEVVSNVLRAAGRLAALQGVQLIVNHPLQLHWSGPGTAASSSTTTTSSSRQEAASLQAASSSSSTTTSSSSSKDDPLQLLPRPVPPLLVSAARGVVARALGYVLDVALQCTPRGGQLCVTARQAGTGVELCVLHTGQLQPNRLHPSSAQMAAALPPLQRARRQPQQHPAGLGGRDGSRAAGRQQQGSAAILEGRSLGGSGGGVSGLVSLEFARQLLAGAGGRVSVVYPCQLMNARSGQLELGTSVEVWLPAAQQQ